MAVRATNCGYYQMCLVVSMCELSRELTINCEKKPYEDTPKNIKMIQIRVRLFSPQIGLFTPKTVSKDRKNNLTKVKIYRGIHE